MELQQKIEAITDEMIAIRRELHQHPELGTQELETQKRISALLDKWGIEHKPCAASGRTSTPCPCRRTAPAATAP